MWKGQGLDNDICTDFWIQNSRSFPHFSACVAIMGWITEEALQYKPCGFYLRLPGHFCCWVYFFPFFLCTFCVAKKIKYINKTRTPLQWPSGLACLDIRSKKEEAVNFTRNMIYLLKVFYFLLYRRQYFLFVSELI